MSFNGGKDAGFARLGYKLRLQRRTGLVSSDHGLVADSKICLRCYSCSERQPGLCHTTDADVYESPPPTTNKQ